MLPRRATILFLVLLAAPASAALAQGDDARGREILRGLDDGTRSCAETSAADFEAVGEYLMARMAGDTRAHGAMDDLMRSMMGSRGESAAHTQMGRRAGRCGGGPVGAMMGMMMGTGGPLAPDLAVAADRDAQQLSDDDWHGEDTAMVVLMGLLLALAGAALWVLLKRGPAVPPSGHAAEILARRFAAGEITEDDYDRRRRALGGTR